jgi:hypothetical protein
VTVTRLVSPIYGDRGGACVAQGALVVAIFERSLSRALIVIGLAACAPEQSPTLGLADAGIDDARIVHPIDLDAGSCESECRPTSACDDAHCEADLCIHTPRADGAVCAGDESSLCVDHACVVRRCGDGWREPGSPAHPREACDLGDGSLFCDATCSPVSGELASALSVEDVRDLAVAIDAAGRVLVLVVQRFDADASLTALQFDSRLRPSAPPLEVAHASSRWAVLEPATTGLTDGWAIALQHEPEGLVVGVLLPDADMPPHLAPFGSRSELAVEPDLVALSSGFVVAATDLGGSVDDPLGGIRAQVFDSAGRARGADFLVPSDPSALETSVALAASGDRWTAAWSRRDPLDGDSSIRTRAFEGSRPSAPERIRSTPARAAWSPRVRALPGGEIVLTWLESDSGTDWLSASDVDGDAAAETLESAGTLSTPEIVPVSATEFALTYLEGTRPVLRATPSAASELTTLVTLTGGAQPRWASTVDTALAVWGEPTTGRLIAFRMALR